MICRIYIDCPGCKSSIALRLQVGIDSQQPFYFVCQKCGAPTKGFLIIDYDKNPPGLSFELEDVQFLREYIEEPEQTITIAPDLPCLITPNDNPASEFPFIYQSDVTENPEDLVEIQTRLGDFRETVEANWPKVRRLTSYYLDRNWPSFDNELSNIFDKDISAPKTELQRHDAFERVLGLLFVPIQLDPIYLELRKELGNFISAVSQRRTKALVDFANEAIERKEPHNYQIGLIERLSFIVDNFSSLCPGFPIMFYDEEKNIDLGQIRIMRDDFEILKSHYLGCFEIAHKVLNLLVGMTNIYVRGNENSFLNNTPCSLERFARLPNARKAQYIDISVLPDLSSQWNIYFNRGLRNAIGHNSVRHDLKTGMLLLDDGVSIPYSEFVVNNLRLLPALLFCLNAVKKIFAIKEILGPHDWNE